MDWPTVILIIAAIVGALALLWILVFVFMARRVFRFQKRVADDILGDRDAEPGPGRNYTSRAVQRRRRERGEL